MDDQYEVKGFINGQLFIQGCSTISLSYLPVTFVPFGDSFVWNRKANKIVVSVSLKIQSNASLHNFSALLVIESKIRSSTTHIAWDLSHLVAQVL
jgi:hypothetical protein